MRVARLVQNYDPTRGGVARTVSVLEQELRHSGVETVIYSLGSASNSGNSDVRVVPRTVAGVTEFWRTMASEGFEILHSHGYYSINSCVALLPRLLGTTKLVLTAHYHMVGKRSSFQRWLFDRSIGRWEARLADQIHVDTALEADALARLHHVPKSKFRVVPPPLHPIFGDRLTEARQGPGSPFVVLFVGRLDQAKGIADLIEAVSTARAESGIEIRLRIVGPDQAGLARAWREMAAAAKLADAEFLGNVSDIQLRSLYDSSSVVVLPSRYEAFGIVLLESLSRGTPVVATRVGGIPTFVRHDHNGLIVEYGDIQGLARAIKRLASDEHLWMRLASNARSSVLRYASAEVAKSELRCYRELLATQNARAQLSAGE